jgi:uncharacterized membrane protein
VKDSRAHRAVDWLWVVLMAGVALSSLFVNMTCTFGPFSWIHLLTLVTLVTLPFAVLAARRHQVSRNVTMMISLFTCAPVIAGTSCLAISCTMLPLAARRTMSVLPVEPFGAGCCP